MRTALGVRYDPLVSVEERRKGSRADEIFLANCDEAVVEVEAWLLCSTLEAYLELDGGSECTGWVILEGGGTDGKINSSPLCSTLAGGDGGGGPTGTASTPSAW